MSVSAPFVILMGMGVTFFGLICLIALVTLMGVVLRPKAEEKKQPRTENQAEVIAAVSAAIAEEMGTDVTALRIVRMRRV